MRTTHFVVERKVGKKKNDRNNRWKKQEEEEEEESSRDTEGSVQVTVAPFCIFPARHDVVTTLTPLPLSPPPLPPPLFLFAIVLVHLRSSIPPRVHVCYIHSRLLLPVRSGRPLRHHFGHTVESPSCTEAREEHGRLTFRLFAFTLSSLSNRI